MPPVAAAKTFATAIVAPGIVLDSRRALMHPRDGWLAVADLHYGYELRRRRQGTLMPDWGMARCEEVLHALINDHRPQRLILVGDVMDGAGCAHETLALLDRLRRLVKAVICIEGNHDRPALTRGAGFVLQHHECGFVFHHGHRALPPVPPHEESSSETVHITGHEHPAAHLSDGAGLRLKLPALVQQRVSADLQHWILPAFSPWAAGGEYRSPHQRLATWVCSSRRVWLNQKC